MPLVPFNDLLTHAVENQYGIGYFEAWDSYSIEAVIDAAEVENAPVIIGFGCMMLDRDWLDAGGIEILGAIGLQKALRTSTPVALLLNEAKTYEQAIRGIAAGFNAVMVDTSDFAPEVALDVVKKLVTAAKPAKVAVEAELGRLPDALLSGEVDDSHATLTDPDEAMQFVETTGVDCLAVSFGNVHILADGYASVNLEHLAKIRRKLSVPMAVHGGTSFPPEAVQGAIAQQAVKFNVGTILKRSFLQGMRQAIDAAEVPINVHDVMGSHHQADFLEHGKAAMQVQVQRLMQLYGSSNQAINF